MEQEVRREDGPHKDITAAILKAAFAVSNALGSGFLEKVYENALTLELRTMGLDVFQQVPVRILYRGQDVGEYCADMVVNRAVLVETKATETHHPIYEAQTLNYLKALNLQVGLLLNFGLPKLQYKRLVLSDKHRMLAPDEPA